MRQGHLPWRGELAAADQADIGDCMVRGMDRAGGDDGMRPVVRPATRWIRVVSSASAGLIAGRMVARRRASLDFPAPGGPRSKRLWSERPHNFPFHAHLTEHG
jgi:hypothetical protein